MKQILLLAQQMTEIAPPVEALPSYETAFLKMVISLAALIVGVIGTVWIWKRLSGGRFGRDGESSIQIVGKKAISPKTMIYVIEVDGKQTVISESQLEVKPLMTLEIVKEVNTP